MKKVFLFLISPKNGISGLLDFEIWPPSFGASQLPRLSEKSGYGHDILVSRGCDPSGLRQGSRPLAAPSFRACAEYSLCTFQPIRFVRFDNESVYCGVDPWRRPKDRRLW